MRAWCRMRSRKCRPFMFGQSSAASPCRVPGGMKFHRGERGPTCIRPRQTELPRRKKKKMQSRVNAIYSKIWTTKRVIVWSSGAFKEFTFCGFLHLSTITSVLPTCSPAKRVCNQVNEATVQHSLQKKGEFHLGWRTHTQRKNLKNTLFYELYFFAQKVWRKWNWP